ncbi:unnamed protein product [Rhizoctonia solani]|uniref:Xylanolytic transcriptional activator regulatory domain-containing protein n=1 Tax=Rhizoctonia solani TaxID=456999 RepID=A0A8H3BCX2_9AGAM|nr:unnamed protein product [Rhizoctonia solani]
MRLRELESEITQLKVESVGDSEKINQEGHGASPISLATAVDDSKEEHPRRSHLTIREGRISASGPTSMWSTFLDEPAPPRENKMDRTELIYRYIFQQIPSMPLESQSKDIRMSAQCEWDRHLPKIDADIRFTRLEHDTLLYTYFKYHNLWLSILEPDLFLRDMLLELVPDPDGAVTSRSDDLTYYSPFLHCALIAFATAFSNDPGVRLKRVREQFANRAKQLLEAECEHPTLTAIQGLVFLSEYHGSLGDRGLAYLYFGISCRLTRAHKLMSLEYGRDYDICLPHLDVPLPTVDPICDRHAWDQVRSTGNQDHASQPNQSTLVFFEACRLMLIAIRVMDTAYLQGRQQLGAMENDNIANIHKLLENWYNNLPTQVRMPSRPEASALPHVILLNITYWWLLILLHRPFSFRTDPELSTSWKSVPTTFADLSADMCEKAAKSIVQLVAIFNQTYGSRFFPLNMLQTIFVAGVILIGRYTTLPSSSSKQHIDTYKMIQECIRALRAAEHVWKPAMLYASGLERLLVEQSSWSSLHSQNTNVYEPTAPDHDDSVARMFQDFIVPHDQGIEELGIPVAKVQFQYPLLQLLTQQPQWGIPSGSEFMANPSALPLSFGSPLDGDEFAGEIENFSLNTGL